VSLEIHYGVHTVQQNTRVDKKYWNFLFLILMSLSSNVKLKAENIPLKRSTYISLSAYNASAMVAFKVTIPTKRNLKFVKY
jgi:hypothetical protein